MTGALRLLRLVSDHRVLSGGHIGIDDSYLTQIPEDDCWGGGCPSLGWAPADGRVHADQCRKFRASHFTSTRIFFPPLALGKGFM